MRRITKVFVLEVPAAVRGPEYEVLLWPRGGGAPAWVFDRPSLLSGLDADFKCVQEWPGFDDPDRRMTYRGIHWERKERSG